MSWARTCVSLAPLVAGLLLVVVSSAPPAGGETAKRGGTLRLVYNLVFVVNDPQVVAPGSIPDATHLTLYAFHDREGDKRLRPAAAAGLPYVSADGRTYTITVRRGFRFSDGKPVTARNYAFAINRLFDPRLDSPFSYIFEDIVGARKVREANATSVAGVTVRGDKLIVRLEEPRPDFVVRLTHPALSATSLDMPIVPGAVVEPAPSAGPYYMREHVPGQRAVFARNPFWRRELLPHRPANVDRIVFERAGLSPVEAVEAVERDEVDLQLVQGIPGVVPGLAKAYGINRERLFVRPRLVFWGLTFNNDGPLLRHNRNLRRAINYALDRPELVRQWGGELVGRRTDQLLPPGLPGYRNWDVYSLKGPNLQKARALASGNLRSAKAVYYSQDAAQLSFAPKVAEVVKFNLARIGLDVDVETPGRVSRRLVTPGEPWDLALTGWFADYPDPYVFLNLMFDGRNIRPGDTSGLNFGRFDDPVFNRRLRRVARLSGDERLEKYARLERDLIRDAAPMAPFFLLNDVIFVSKGIGCVAYHVSAFVNLVAICKK